MVSGKYSALSGAVAREQAMANIANNLANVNSSGFKKDRVSFEALLRGSKQVTDAKGINYSRIRTIGTDFSQGAMRLTGRPLDVAIAGDGFFKIQKNDQLYYTRAGSFSVDPNGMLVTADGFEVLDEGNQTIQLADIAGKKLVIDDSGNISLDGIAAQAKVPIFRIEDTDQLEKKGNMLFQLKGGSEDSVDTDSRLVQGSLETSNVNMMEEMVTMIDTQRKFEAYHKVLKSYSTLGEKQSELGTLG